MYCDLADQYGPMFLELFRKIKEGGSLLYSWSAGLGACFYGNLINYCASPFTLLILLFGEKYLPEALAVMIVLKAVTSAVTFSIFINKTRNIHPMSVSFSVAYALSAFFVANTINIMWLDAMYILPLVILGIHKIDEKKVPVLFICSLAYAMLSNYYMGFMICIFCILYFIYHFILTSQGNIKTLYKPFVSKGFIFAGGGIAAFLLSAFVLLPQFFCLRNTGAVGDSFPDAMKFYITPFEFISSLFAGMPTSLKTDEDISILPNIFCSVFALFLVVSVFANKKIPKKNKLCYGGVIGVYYLFFSCNVLNYILHGLHYPHSFPHRFSFCFTFIFLCIAYDSFLSITKLSRKRLFIVSGTACAIVLAAGVLGAVNIKSVVMTLLLIVLYCLLVYIIPVSSKKTVVALLSIAMSVEMLITATPYFACFESKNDYYDKIDTIHDLQADITETDAFFRTEVSGGTSLMNPMLVGYNGLSLFSSMEYKKMTPMMLSLGFYSNHLNSFYYIPQTPVIDMMFDLRYIYDTAGLLIHNDHYDKVSERDQVGLYKTKYPLPIGFMTDEAILEWSADKDPFITQNDFTKRMAGEEVFREYFFNGSEIHVDSGKDFEYSQYDSRTFKISGLRNKKKISASLQIEEQGNNYLCLAINSKTDYYVICKNFTYHFDRRDGYAPCIIALGYLNRGDTVSIQMDIPEGTTETGLQYNIAVENPGAVKRLYEKLSASPSFDVEKFTDTNVTGYVEASTDGALYTSIPYDTNWKIFIDGKEAVYGEEVEAIGGALTGIRLRKGSHRIELSYEACFGKESVMISAVTFIILIFFIAYQKKRPLKRKNAVV